MLDGLIKLIYGKKKTYKLIQHLKNLFQIQNEYLTKKFKLNTINNDNGILYSQILN